MEFKMEIPDYYESGRYQGEIYINNTRYQFNYLVEGYKIVVRAYLDKEAYIEGEKAVLTLDIENIGGQTGVPLISRVKHGSFDESREIVLGIDNELAFEIPAEDFEQKIFYGFYLADIGRSLYLDVQNIHQAYGDFSVTTDRQLYQVGETVYVTVETSEEGWLSLHGPGDFFVLESIADKVNYTIPLPKNLETGTYRIHASLNGKKLDQMIDILGKELRFVNIRLDREEYQNNDPFVLVADINSYMDQNLDCISKFDLIAPDGTTQLTGSKEVEIFEGENKLIFENNIMTNQIGTHRIKVSIIHDGNLVSYYSIPLHIGDIELNGITTDKEEYLYGDNINGTVNLYGSGDGKISVLIDNSPLINRSVEIDGVTSIPYSISNLNLAAGKHKIEALYHKDGKSMKVETEIVYGIDLPDLIVEDIEITKERTESDEIPLKISIRKKNKLTAENIPVLLKIDSKVIDHYVIDSLSEEDEIHEKTILWNTDGFTGVGELLIEIDPEGIINEYDSDNNIKIREVDIPDFPTLDYIPDIINTNSPALNGSTVPGGFVEVYLDGKLIDANHAEENGGFVIDDYLLNQGENELQIKVSNQKLFESKMYKKNIFVDSIKPVIVITNVREEQSYIEDILPQIEVIEDNIRSEEYLLNGVEFNKDDPVTEDGVYNLYVRITDIADNVSEKEVNFTIDKTDPIIDITGVEDKSYYNTTVIPGININDLNLIGSRISLNGEVYTGKAINEEGRYYLEVTAVDKAGNSNKDSCEFIIDMTDPRIKVEGVADGEKYYEPVSIKVEVVDENLSVKEIMLDGLPYTGGTVVNSDGDHELAIRAEDVAGNQASMSRTFTLDLRPDLEIEFDYTEGMRVLVLQNHHSDDSGIVNLLEENKLSYKTCSTIQGFNSEIKTGQYNLYLIMDDSNLWELLSRNKYYKRYNPYKFSGYFNWMFDLIEMDYLLTSKIAKGQSLLYIYGGGYNHFLPQVYFLKDLLGIKYGGLLSSKEWQVDVDQELGEDFTTNGMVLNCWSNGSKIEGKIYKKFKYYYWPKYYSRHHHRYNWYYPAILNNHSGKGDVYTMTFNPFSGKEGWEDRVKLLLNNILNNLKPEISSQLPTESLFSLELYVKNTGRSKAEMRHIIELPEGYSLIEDGGYSNEGNRLIQEFTLDPGKEVNLKSFGVTPYTAGEYRIKSALYYYNNLGQKNHYKDISIDCQIE